MTDLRIAAQQALEALKDDQYRLVEVSPNQYEYKTGLLVEVSPNQYEYKTDLAIAALERALAQQAEPVEPVAWCSSVEFSDALKYAQSFNGWRRKYPKTDMPLYTAPPQRKPLTDEEILEMAEKAWKPSVYYDAAALLGTDGLVALVRAVERAHKIGDNT